MAAGEDPLFTLVTHHHMLPDFFWQETQSAHTPVGGLAPLPIAGVSISFMDDACIDVTVPSLSTSGVHTGMASKARTLARRCNEFAAELRRVRPDRFASLACLPLPVALRDSPRETLANLSISGHLRGFSDQSVAEIVQCGEPILL
jgi:predicted TIM-barrel fold metal-dependent hydrolase